MLRKERVFASAAVEDGGVLAAVVRVGNEGYQLLLLPWQGVGCYCCRRREGRNLIHYCGKKKHELLLLLGGRGP